MPLDIVVTNAGRAALINADNTGTAPVTISQVGLSSAAVAAAPTLTALAGEFKRVGAVSGEVVADDTIHLSVMDSSGDSYTLRSVGLYLEDGTLFAIYGQPGTILEKTANSDAALSVDVIFANTSAALLTFGDASFVNPPATTERQGVVELSTLAEARAGMDALRALTPAGGKAAILGWLLAQDGAGSGIDSDLLDGRDGAWYADIIARLGFSPLSAALYTAADVLTKLLTVDGAGSGIDADLLDGLQAAAFAQLAARNVFTDINRFSGVEIGSANSYIYEAGAALVVKIGGQFFGFLPNGQLRIPAGGLLVGGDDGPLLYREANNLGIRVGTPGNYHYLNVSAAGELLLNSYQFARITAQQKTANGGYRIYSDGYKECWGTDSYTADQTKTIAYPFSFTSWSKAFVEGGVSSIGQQENGPFVTSASLTGFTGLNASNATVPVFWKAFGY